MRPIACALLLGVLLVAGCASPGADEPPGNLGSANGKGPVWSFVALDGSTQSRDEPASNATVLFFMATWCGSCRAKAPVLADVGAEYASKGVRMLSLDFDPTETEADVRAWQERYDHPWPHGIDEGLTMQRLFGVKTQSSVLVLDSEGRVTKHFGYGQVSADTLRAALDAALAA